MNKLTIIGNLTRDPELRSTPDGISVCDFSVAVNRKRARENEPEADFFRVTVWRERGENCAKYLQKGSKVCVIGSVSVRTYTGNDGVVRAVLEVKDVDEVEFLSRPQNGEQSAQQQPEKVDKQTGFQAVETDELPF